jgi:hypothetical protein
MERTKRLFATLAAGAVLFGCGGSGPEAHVPSRDPDIDQPDDPIAAVDEEEVDYRGFTIAPPSGPLDARLKQSFDDKLGAMVESADVPSTLAGAFFQLGRAYLSGREPVTQIEVEAFEKFDAAPAETLAALERTLERIDELPQEDMARLYGADFIEAGVDHVLTYSIVSNALTKELEERATIEKYGDLERPLGEEHPGLVREGSCYGVDGFTNGPCPNVCGIKTAAMGGAPAVRTAFFEPALSLEDYEDRELEEDRGGNCRGNWIERDGERICARVPAVAGGETIRLEGFNFHDVNAEVHLVPWTGGIELRPVVVEAHVRGAKVSPLDRARWDQLDSIGENGQVSIGGLGGDFGDGVDTQSGAPATCEAGDEIHFQVPADLYSGMYKVRLVMKDPVERYQEKESNNIGQEPFIQVVSPASTEYEITAERMTNAGTFDGETRRDELGLKFYVMSEGKLETFEFEYGGVARWDIRCIGEMNDDDECEHQTLFSGSLDMPVAYSILGLEIDDDDAYENDIRNWETLYEDVSKGVYGKVATGVGGLIGTLVGKITTKEIGAVVGTVIAEGIKRGIVAWAPSDVRVADRGAFTFLEVDEYTSSLAPTPSPYEYNVLEDVDVVVEPCQDIPGYRDRRECDAEAKGPGVYREIRAYYVGVPDSGEYRECGHEFADGYKECNYFDASRYHVTLRYERLN